MGKLVAAHSSNETSMITVPARYRKALPRSTRRIMRDENFGQRYGGISRMKGASLLLSSNETSMITVPARYRKALPRSTRRIMRDENFGQRYGGISRMKGASLLLS